MQSKPLKDSFLNLDAWKIILVVITISITFMQCTESDQKTSDTKKKNKNYVNKPTFKKEGELSFLAFNSSKTFKQIDIEIADNEAEIQQGLMFRTSMSYEEGMLFIFEQDRPRSFWMKNTAIALDVIFINEALEIVSIQKNTIPYSEEPIPSNNPAKFVLEVKAGFCDTYGVEAGQKITYQNFQSS